MPFDPDAYLAKKTAPPVFDPDAYLAKKKPEAPRDIFSGLSEETKQSILEKYPDVPESAPSLFGKDFKAGFTGGFDQQKATERVRRRAANLERIRQDNPYLAREIESMGPLEVGLIGAGKKVEDVGQGLGRLVGILDAEDVRDDPNYQKLRSVRNEAQLGEILSEAGMMAIPGAQTSKIVSLTPRLAAASVTEGAISGLGAAGEGGDTGDIATATAIGGLAGPLLSEAVSPLLKAGPRIRPERPLEPDIEAPLGRPRVEEVPVEEISITQLPKNAQRREAIKTGDKAGAGYRIDPDSGKVVKDPAQEKALKQGFADTLVVKIPSMSPATKETARKILSKAENVLRKGFGEGARNPPAAEMGDSVMKRFNAVRKANREAGTDIRRAVDKIKNEEVDVTDIADQFSDNLDNMDVGYELTKKGMKLDFKDSLADAPGAQKSLQWVFNRLKTTDTVEGLQKIKKYLDDKINFDENPMNQEPMARDVSNALKDVRRGINQKIRSMSDEYADANDRFSETVTAMNNVMDVMGRRFDPDSDSVNSLVGQQLRKTLSNYGVGPDMTSAIDTLDATAAKYGNQFDDDVIALIDFYSELERRFGSFKSNSFQGVQEKAIEQGMKSALKGEGGGIRGAAVDFVYDKAMGVNEENAIQAMRDLLRR